MTEELLTGIKQNWDLTKANPFHKFQTGDALENIENIRNQMVTLKKQEQELRKGLNIFKIDQPPSKEIGNLEKVG